MTLSLYELRCQGRTTRAMGAATLCGECTDCRRRTDIPAGQAVRYMNPPPPMQVSWFGSECPQRIGPVGVDVVDC